ncbi:hypothetical protein M3Y97_00192800 [Aphelenchoides bicaudatus]|nr:hypothetical protein M3Y97_00192800 [Aphelenchoides bicaudatus]
MADYRRYSSTDSSSQEEVELDEQCCFGRFSAFKCLPTIVFINFLVDSGAAFLSIGSDFIYCFGVIAVFSLLCFGAALSGVQEEQSGKIKLSIGWALIKVLILLVLITCSIAALIDLDWFVEMTHLNVNTKICTALIVLLPLAIVLLYIQLRWSRQMLKIIRIRDLLYIIPSEIGPVAMRNSLRLHLEGLNSTMNLKRCSIATVLEPGKY